MVKAITQFEANDGTVFASEYEAIKHETKCEFKAKTNQFYCWIGGNTRDGVIEFLIRNKDDAIEKLKQLDEDDPHINVKVHNVSVDFLNKKNEKIEKAIKLALEYGRHDKARHKQYGLDKIIRTLAGNRYSEIIHDYEYDFDDDEKSYVWDAGIAP